MEYLVLGLFAAGLLICLVFGVSTVWALLFGLLLFTGYGLRRGYSLSELARAGLAGALKLKTILLVFVFIGSMTALWRASGTIAVIVCYASNLIRPAIFPLISFLLCCGISFLTGSSFASSATMGVVCASVGRAMGFSPALIGGAVLSGVYFGDRCSPVSTSALLTAQVTETDIFSNIKGMFRSAAVPFALTCIAYGLIRSGAGGEASVSVRALFERGYDLSAWALAPAVLILVLAALRVNVKIAMGASILCSVPLCLFLQKMSVPALLQTILLGYRAADPEIAAMMDGGGIASMFNVALIIFIAGLYSGIFEKTGLLLGLRGAAKRLAEKTTPFFSLLAVSTVLAAATCNQTLTTMLSASLCADFYESKERLAGDIENSAIVIPALIPWSIACSVPLAALGAPTSSVFFAFYVWLLPLWGLIRSLLARARQNRAA